MKCFKREFPNLGKAFLSKKKNVSFIIKTSDELLGGKLQ